MRVQQVHGVEESDVPRGGGRRHVERRLLEGGRLVDGPGEGADTAGQEQKLVDLQTAITGCNCKILNWEKPREY